MSGQDGLLATKLHVPRPQPGFVPRPRLVQALSHGLARGRVLVCAPAGFGKTALLADWARDDRRPVAWLGLDDGDSDPAGSGATWWPRWRRPGRGWPGGWARHPRGRLEGW
jgi:ATP/maltotriose-dependent transcriptional regulator MalT